MIWNYLKITYRTLWKQRVFSFINLMGLSMGMTIFLLLIAYVQYERSYDRHHPMGGQLYRVALQMGEAEAASVALSAPLGPLMAEQLAGVAGACRIFPQETRVESQSAMGSPVLAQESRFYYTDPAVWQLFGIEVLAGSPEGLWQQPGQVAITHDMAVKYFGNALAEDPARVLGMPLELANQFGLVSAQVAAVVANPPHNTHWHYDFLVPMAQLKTAQSPWARLDNPGWQEFRTYVRLQAGTNPEGLLHRLEGTLEAMGFGSNLAFSLQPVQSIHLHSQLQGELAANGNARTVAILALVALFVLVIAWVNYVNLSTARAIERAKEVGVRKTSGGTLWQLRGQFLVEALVLNLLALVLALTVVQLVQASVSGLTGVPVSLKRLLGTPLGLGTMALFVFGALLSGGYPAFVLSAFRPAAVLKGTGTRLGGQGNGGRLRLRHVLVVFQFATSVALLAAAMGVYLQVAFMQQKDLGMNIEELLVVKGPENLGSHQASRPGHYLETMLAHNQVATAASSQNIPGMGYNYGLSGLYRQGEEDNRHESYQIYLVDDHFVETYGLTLLAGAGSRAGTQLAGRQVLLNHQAMQQLGFASPEEAVGTNIYAQQEAWEVIGVVADYHHLSLKNALEPIVFSLTPCQAYFTFKYQGQKGPKELEGFLHKAEEAYAQMFPGNPFDYFFLDQLFDAQYRAERRFGKVFGLFALLAVGVALMGLLGLTAYAAAQRTKEIGVRKVMGASSSSILFMLTKDFMKLMLLASLIAVPVAWFGMNQWLANFPYHVNIQWWWGVVPPLALCALAWLAIALQTWRTVRLNPVHSLRYE